MASPDKYITIRRYKSRSDDGTTHRVTKNSRTGQLRCSCKGWEFHKHCLHITRVLASMGISIT